MKNNSVCSVCEEGNLHIQVETNLVEYKNHKKELPLHYSECDCCGSDITTPEQSRCNKRLMTEFKKQVDGLLTGREVKGIRLALGLTQADAAKIFGGGPVAFSKYEADDVAQSEAMDKLLRVAQAVPEAYAHLTHNSGYARDVEHEVPSKQWDWENLLQGLNATEKPKPRPTLKLISSKDFGHSDGYGKIEAVG
jgi:HTH-type transcriptional regulator/antitoxin MqsA